MTRTLLVVLISLTSCATAHKQQSPQMPSPSLTEATKVEEPAPPQVTAPAEATFIPADAPEVQTALQTYVRSGKAPIIEQKRAGFVRYPYGLSQPVVYCQPLRVCDIELEAGEQILGVPICGDGGKDGRWVIDGFLSGPPNKRIPHVTVKPTDWNLSTNLTIGTDRRVYYIALVSKPNSYLRRIGFYYPDDAVAKFNAMRNEAHATQQQVAASLPSLALDQLDDRYQIDGHATWKPTWIANDGTRTFVKMPTDLHQTDAPTLFIEHPNGQQALVNFRQRAGFYIVDTVFDRAILTWGSGREQQTVTITRAGR